MAELERNTKLVYRHYDNNSQAAGDTVVAGIRYFQQAIDPASITNATAAETTFTLYGAKVGDMIFANPPASLEAGLVYSGVRVSAANTVAVRLGCIGAAPVDGTSRTWSFVWFSLGA